jgi:hypothetical protein
MAYLGAAKGSDEEASARKELEQELKVGRLLVVLLDPISTEAPLFGRGLPPRVCVRLSLGNMAI